MSFYSIYDLIDLVRDDGIKTFQAREIATGRQVLVHLFPTPQSLEQQALLRKVAKLPAEARVQILAQGDHEGTPYVVTAPITAYLGFREWLVSQKSAVEPAAVARPEAPSPRSAAPPPIAQDDPFAALFKKPAVPEPPPARPVSRGPVRASTEAFRHLIETPTTKKPAMQPIPPPATGPEGTRFMSSGDYAAAFESKQASSAAVPMESAPPVKDSGTQGAPGEFTRMFQAPPPAALSSAPAGAEAAPAAQPAGEFTRMFQMPPAPAVTPPPGSEPGEFTRMFQAPAAPPAAPSSAAPLPTTARMVSASREQPAGAPPTTLAQEAGEFTRMFHTGGIPVEPSAPTPAQTAPPTLAQEGGDFTGMFQTAGIPAAPSTPTPPKTAPPMPGQEAGEFTRIFQTGGIPAALSVPTPPQTAPATPGQEAGDFTRMFQAGGIPAAPSVPPPPQAVPATPAQGGGDLTRMFQAGGIPAAPSAPPPPQAAPATPVQQAGDFTRMFAPPAQTPTPPPRQPSAGGEFTRMFTVPPTGQRPQPSTPAPPYPRQSAGEFSSPAAGPSPKSDEPGEFTRMFDSPLHPAPLSPPQGAADPFAGRGHIPPPQAAPVGEFTGMFGKGDKAPPIAPMGTPTPRSPAGGSATNVFKTPQAQAPGGYGYPGQASGPSEYTTMMTKPSAGILAEAAATAVPEKKSFFKTYLPVILFFGALLIVLILILIMRKH